MTTKICTKCKTEKNIDCFGKKHDTKDSLAAICKNCANIKTAIWRKNNPQKTKLQVKEWYKNNKEKSNAYHAKYRLTHPRKPNTKWREENRVRINELRNLRHLENPEKRKMQNNAWYENNKELCKKKNAEWTKNNPEKIKIKNQKRRTAKSTGSLTATHIKAMYISQKEKCPVCKKSIKDKYHIDHVTPLAKGGSNDIENIQLLCPFCNLSKGAKDPIEFMQSRGFLL